MRIFHETLGREVDLPDASAEVLIAESGWKPAPEPEAIPGHEPDPVVYAPVTKPDPEPETKPTESKPRRKAD